MPRVKGMFVNLPRLLRKNAVNLIMLGYVMGFSKNAPIPILQIRKGVKKFTEEMDLSEDDFPLESAMVEYYRMIKDYNSLKSL